MLPLFFIPDLQNPELTGDNAHHANRVLRMKIAEELLVSDGNGQWARCEICKVDKQSISLEIKEQDIEPVTENVISIVQALPKSDRAKEAVELLTASGVTEIYPWCASRSIGRESDKWEKVAIEASKQSRRFRIPIVHAQLRTDQVISLFSTFDQVLICHESALEKISDVVRPAPKTLIVIGPEGGITDDELILFKSAGGKTIKLGRPVLRSAHAGLAAVSAVSSLMKVW
jgi:16S rRNA (uracil1498-N3)-methyltransferase